MHTYAHTHVHTFIYMQVDTYTHTYTYTYTYTYTCMPAGWRSSQGAMHSYGWLKLSSAVLVSLIHCV